MKKRVKNKNHKLLIKKKNSSWIILNNDRFLLTIMLLAIVMVGLFVSFNAQTSSQHFSGKGELAEASPVGAPAKSSEDVVKTIAGGFSSFFTGTKWSEGLMEANVAKIFLFAMLTIIFYLLLGSFFPGSAGWIFVLSLLISFLSTAYITPEEVYSLLISYTALGLTITTLVPLAILMALTYRAVIAREGQVPLIMLQLIAWVLFAFYSIYKYVSNWGEGSNTVNWIILLTAIASALMAVFNGPIRRLLMKLFVAAETEAAHKNVREAVGGIKTAAAIQRGAAGAANKNIDLFS